MSNESFKSSQNLRKAMEEAQRLTVVSPTPEPSPQHGKYSDTEITVDSGSSVLELLRSMSNEETREEDLEEEEEEVQNDRHYDKENDKKKEPFPFSMKNMQSNQLAAAAAATSSSTASKRDEVDVKKPSANVDSAAQEAKIQFRLTKKAPSPPLPDLKPTNVTSTPTTEVTTSNSRNISALPTK